MNSREAKDFIVQEFEAEYDSAIFEAKISKLMKRAYARLKSENPQSAILWDEAMDALLAGDHYLLVMWDLSAASRVPATEVIRLVAKILIPLLIVAAAFWSFRDHVGSVAHLVSILFFSGVAVVIVISILQAVRPQAAGRLIERTVYGLIKYLFGRRDANKTP